MKFLCTPTSLNYLTFGDSQSKPWKGLFRRKDSTTPSIFSDFTGDEISTTQQPVLEVWSLEVPRIRVPLPMATLLKMVKKQDNKSILKNLNLLPKSLKEEFHNLMEDKNLETSQYTWQLVGIEITKHRVRIGLFSYSEGGISVLVIIQRQNNGNSDTSVWPKGPRGNRSNVVLSSGTGPPMQKLPSILKKPVDPLSAEKQPEAVPSVESRVRISSESPEVNYAESEGTQDTTIDPYSLEERSPNPASRSSAVFNSPSRRAHMLPELSSSKGRVTNPYTYNSPEGASEMYDSPSSIRNRQRSRSRDSRHTYEDYHDALSAIRRKFEEDYPGYPTGTLGYSPSRLGPRSSYHDPYMPSIDERVASRSSHYDDIPGYDPDDYTYRPRGRLPPRRTSTLDSLDDYRSYPGISPQGRPSPNIHIYNTADRNSSRLRSPDSRRVYEELAEDWNTSRRSRPRRRESIEREITINRRPPPPPPPPGLHQISPYGPPAAHPDNFSSEFHRSPSPRRRRRSSLDSYDVMFNPPRMFYGDSAGDNQMSSPPAYPQSPAGPTRRTTMSPDRRPGGGNEMALVLRDHFVNEEFERLKKRAKKHAYRQPSVRKKSGDDYSGDDRGRSERRSRREGRKATIEDYDESDGAGPEVLDKYKSMFNPNYEPPVVNGTAKAKGSGPARGAWRDSDFWGHSLSAKVDSGIVAAEDEDEEEDIWAMPKKSKKKKKKEAIEYDDVSPSPPPDPEPLAAAGTLAEDDWGWAFGTKKTGKKEAKEDKAGPGLEQKLETNNSPELETEPETRLASFLETAAEDEWGGWSFRRKDKKSPEEKVNPEPQPPTSQESGLQTEDEWGAFASSGRKKKKKKKSETETHLLTGESVVINQANGGGRYPKSSSMGIIR